MMKKLLLLGMGLFISLSVATAQDTLLYQDFEDSVGLPPIFAYGNVAYPNATIGDTIWTNYDQDQIPDASGGARPDEWFWTYPYTVADSTAHGLGFGSNSWTNDFANPVADWLITPSLAIGDSTFDLTWLAATSQTPRYLDGYVVLVSTTNNDLPSFTDTLFVAAEYDDEGGTYPQYCGDWASYTFSPPGGFVFGLDGMYIAMNPGSDGNAADTTCADSARYRASLRPFFASLAGYAGQNIYIAFKHNSHDDNTMVIDEILVYSPTAHAGIETLPDFTGSVYPNPATDFVDINFDINKYHHASVQIVNNSGQVIYTSPLVTQNHKINLQNIAAGIYYVKMLCDEGNLVKKLIVTK